MFLNRYKEIVLSGNLEELDKFIVNREVDIKGKERAKLTNPDLAYYGEENKLRGSKLDFRFGPAKRIIIDIVKGIEGESYDKSSQG